MHVAHVAAYARLIAQDCDDSTSCKRERESERLCNKMHSLCSVKNACKLSTLRYVAGKQQCKEQR
jgi:hypothetical protein